jgi:CRP-like cAMP-binding protein
MADGLKHSVQTYGAGSIIFRDGDFRQFLYIVHKGQIGIFKVTPQGNRLPLGIINSGEYLGETGLLDSKTNHATWAIALTDIEVIAIPESLIHDQLKTAPQWLVALTRGMSQKLRRMNDLIRRNKLTDDTLDKAILAVQTNDLKSKANK